MKQPRTPESNRKGARAGASRSRRGAEIPKIKRPVGHPPCYTPEIAAEICRRLAGGEYLGDICGDDGMPTRQTVHGWVVDDHEGFFDTYMRARRASALSKMDEIQQIADESGLDFSIGDDGKLRVDGEVVKRADLRIKTRQWVMERVYQRVFGSKMDLTSDGKAFGGCMLVTDFPVAGGPSPTPGPDLESGD